MPSFPDERVVSRAELLEAGHTPKGITRAVRAGVIRRLRRDHYVRSASASADIAVRIGGLLTCVSALATAGVFTVADGRVHVHVSRGMSRLRSPGSRRDRWDRERHGGTSRLHWGVLATPATREAVGLEDAVRTLIRCRPPREVIAALDSVLQLKLLTYDELNDIFATLPGKYRVLLRLVDARAESGTETFVRLILRQLGVPFEIQVVVSGVGRVDFLIAGRLILECDSKAHHSDWVQRRKDIKRDQEAARRGYIPVRILAEDILYRPDEVRDLLVELLNVHLAV